jgi:hypothetical protein
MIRPTTNYQEKPKLLTITDRNIGQCVKLSNEIILTFTQVHWFCVKLHVYNEILTHREV